MGRWSVALVLVGAATCARRNEYIGRVQTADGSLPAIDAPAGPPAPAPVPDAAAPRPEAALPPAASCPNAEPIVPSVQAPIWNCGTGGDRCFRDPSVDPALFAGATLDTEPMRRPALIYPHDRSLHPINLARITFQWRRGTPAQTSFRIRIAGTVGGEPAIDIFVPYVEPSVTPPPDARDAAQEIPEAVWRYVADHHAGQEVGITVTGHDPSTNQIATSTTTTIRFSNAPVEGGLFYLTTEGPNAGIQRHVFGSSSVEPVVKPLSPANEFNCGGCHSVSRNGTTLAFAATYAGNLTVTGTNNFENPLRRPPVGGTDEADGVSPAVSPDGRYVLARHGVSQSLVLYEATNNNLAVVGARTVGETVGRIDFPEWSPDGTAIVATRASVNQANAYSAVDGHLVVMSFSPSTRELGQPQPVLYEDLEVHSHPSWSPDGQWIVFVSSPVGTETHRNARTRLRLVNRQGTLKVDLFEAMGGLGGIGRASTFPKFAPLAQRSCNLMFITFQSRMDYGVLRRNGTASNGGYPQLWMSALDLTRLPGADPSFPPVWLPFQDINQLNLLPIWTAPPR